MADVSPPLRKGAAHECVLNGSRFDYLNRHVTSKNETPERLRLPPFPRNNSARSQNFLGFFLMRIEQWGRRRAENTRDLGVPHNRLGV